MELKSNIMKLESFSKVNGFQNQMHLKPQNTHIWVLWKKNINIKAIDVHQQCISVIANDRIKDYNIRITTIYADTDYVKRRVLWNHLANLKDKYTGPWIIKGDYNAIMSCS